MPVWWYLDETKEIYKKYYNIQCSRCYSEYGMKRTGCAGCPFGRDYLGELHIMETYEPKLYKMAMAIFGKSYEYTKKYHEYRERKDEKQSKK